MKCWHFLGKISCILYCVSPCLLWDFFHAILKVRKSRREPNKMSGFGGKTLPKLFLIPYFFSKLGKLSKTFLRSKSVKRTPTPLQTDKKRKKHPKSTVFVPIFNRFWVYGFADKKKLRNFFCKVMWMWWRNFYTAVQEMNPVKLVRLDKCNSKSDISDNCDTV